MSEDEVPSKKPTYCLAFLRWVIGGSFGAGNYGMCGRAYEPSFLFSWPNARVSVMGGEQAARVMEIVLLQQLAGTLKKMGVESSAENLDTLREVLHLGSEAARERLSASGLPIHPMGLEIFAQGVREKFKKMGFDLAPDPERGILAQLEASICGQFDRESTALFGTARLWDDGIIDPRDSRRVLGICLSICEERRWREQRGASNTFGVARM